MYLVLVVEPHLNLRLECTGNQTGSTNLLWVILPQPPKSCLLPLWGCRKKGSKARERLEEGGDFNLRAEYSSMVNGGATVEVVVLMKRWEGGFPMGQQGSMWPKTVNTEETYSLHCCCS